MVKFLSILGKVVLQATGIVQAFGPIAQMVYPNAAGAIQTISRDSAEIANVVVNVEAFGQMSQLTGEQKLAAVAPLVAQIVMSSAVVANHKIANPQLFQQGVTKITGGWADVINSFDGNPEILNKLALGPAAGGNAVA